MAFVAFDPVAYQRKLDLKPLHAKGYRNRAIERLTQASHLLDRLALHMDRSIADTATGLLAAPPSAFGFPSPRTHTTDQPVPLAAVARPVTAYAYYVGPLATRDNATVWKATVLATNAGIGKNHAGVTGDAGAGTGPDAASNGTPEAIGAPPGVGGAGRGGASRPRPMPRKGAAPWQSGAGHDWRAYPRGDGRRGRAIGATGRHYSRIGPHLPASTPTTADVLAVCRVAARARGGHASALWRAAIAGRGFTAGGGRRRRGPWVAGRRLAMRATGRALAVPAVVRMARRILPARVLARWRREADERDGMV